MPWHDVAPAKPAASPITPTERGPDAPRERPPTHVLVLEELGDAEEEGGGLLRAKGLADVEEVDDLGEEDAAFAGADGRLVEDACLLDDRLCVGARTSAGREQAARRVSPDVSRGGSERERGRTVLSWKNEPTPLSSSFL